MSSFEGSITSFTEFPPVIAADDQIQAAFAERGSEGVSYMHAAAFEMQDIAARLAHVAGQVSLEYRIADSMAAELDLPDGNEPSPIISLADEVRHDFGRDSLHAAILTERSADFLRHLDSPIH